MGSTRSWMGGRLRRAAALAVALLAAAPAVAAAQDSIPAQPRDTSPSTQAQAQAGAGTGAAADPLQAPQASDRPQPSDRPADPLAPGARTGVRASRGSRPSAAQRTEVGAESTGGGTAAAETVRADTAAAETARIAPANADSLNTVAGAAVSPGAPPIPAPESPSAGDEPRRSSPWLAVLGVFLLLGQGFQIYLLWRLAQRAKSVPPANSNATIMIESSHPDTPEGAGVKPPSAHADPPPAAAPEREEPATPDFGRTAADETGAEPAWSVETASVEGAGRGFTLAAAPAAGGPDPVAAMEPPVAVAADPAQADEGPAGTAEPLPAEDVVQGARTSERVQVPAIVSDEAFAAEETARGGQDLAALAPDGARPEEEPEAKGSEDVLRDEETVAVVEKKREDGSEEPAEPELAGRVRERLDEIRASVRADAAKLSHDAERFERLKEQLLVLHDTWANEVDFPFVSALLRPENAVVRDNTVLLHPVSEANWAPTLAHLRALARGIDRLPEVRDPEWTAHLPAVAVRAAFDHDLRIDDVVVGSPAVVSVLRRSLSTVLLNLKNLRRAQEELGRIVRWLVDAAAGARTPLADGSAEAAAVLDVVWGGVWTPEERAGRLEEALAKLERVDQDNYGIVLDARKRVEALEQKFREFLKTLFGVVDGIDRAKRVFGQAVSDRGLQREALVERWAAVFAELEELLVERVLRERLDIHPMVCVRGDRFDPEAHNALDTDAVPGLHDGDVAEVVNRGYRWGEGAGGAVLKPADVVVAKGGG